MEFTSPVSHKWQLQWPREASLAGRKSEGQAGPCPTAGNGQGDSGILSSPALGGSPSLASIRNTCRAREAQMPAPPPFPSPEMLTQQVTGLAHGSASPASSQGCRRLCWCLLHTWQSSAYCCSVPGPRTREPEGILKACLVWVHSLCTALMRGEGHANCVHAAPAKPYALPTGCAGQEKGVQRGHLLTHLLKGRTFS